MYNALFLTVLIFSAIVPVKANDDIKVSIDGQQIVFDVQPQIINGRTMVPLRAIFEALGATVEWDPKDSRILSSKANIDLLLAVGWDAMSYGCGNITKSIPLDCAPCIIDGRTLIPARAVSEAFGLNVDWNADSRTVVITTPENYYSGYDIKTISTVTGLGCTNSYKEIGATEATEGYVEGMKQYDYDIYASKDEIDEYFSMYNNYLKNNKNVTFIEKTNEDNIAITYKYKLINSSKGFDVTCLEVIEDLFYSLIISFNEKYQVSDELVTFTYDEEDIYESLLSFDSSMNQYLPDETVTFKIGCTNYLNGEKANNIMRNSSSSHKSGHYKEWLILDLYVEYISGRNDDVFDIGQVLDHNFYLAGKQLESTQIEDVPTSYGKNYKDARCRPGESVQFSIAFFVDKSEDYIKLKSSDGKWLVCDGSQKVNKQPSSTEYYPHSNTPTYTSITGVALIDKTVINSVLQYEYKYTTESDVLKYHQALFDIGYTVYDEKEDAVYFDTGELSTEKAFGSNNHAKKICCVIVNKNTKTIVIYHKGMGDAGY